MKQWCKIQCMLSVSITDLLALRPQSFIPNHQFLSLPSHKTLLPLMDQWYKYAFPFTSGFRVKKTLTLPSSSASDIDQVPGGLANPELNRALSTVRHLRNALRWWWGGYSPNNEKSPIKLWGLERTSSTTLTPAGLGAASGALLAPHPQGTQSSWIN